MGLDDAFCSSLGRNLFQCTKPLYYMRPHAFPLGCRNDNSSNLPSRLVAHDSMRKFAGCPSNGN